MNKAPQKGRKFFRLFSRAQVFELLAAETLRSHGIIDQACHYTSLPFVMSGQIRVECTVAEPLTKSE